MDLKLIAFIFLFVSCAICDEGEENNNKIDQEEETDFTKNLNDENFAETIKSNNYFVMFFAPW